MTTTIFGWAADQAGCASYRVRWVADALNELYPDQVSYTQNTKLTAKDREESDVIVGQRVVLPGPTKYWQEFAKAGNKKLVMEFDDDLWTVSETNRRGSAVFNNMDYRKRLEANIMVSHLVTVSTEPLKAAVHKNTGYPLDQIVVIPNALPEHLLDEPQSNADTTLGWLASPTHGKDAEMVQRHVRRLLEGDQNLTFRSIGMDYGEKMKLPVNQTFNSGWIRSPEDAVRTIDYAVGICPLVPSAFNLSKSDCKFLELGARKVAPIVSDVRAYESVTDGVTGVKVLREHEWGRKLRDLVYDTEMQHELAENAHAYVRDHRTTKHTAPLWLEALLP